VIVGVVGGGRIAEQAHLPALAEIADVEVVLCERDQERGRLLAARFGLRTTVTELDELLAAGCDALLVMVPHDAMFEVTRSCLATGTPTLLEKPPGMTVAQTEELAGLADDRGATAMVGFNSRFRPDLRRGLDRLLSHTSIHSVLAYAEMPSHDRLRAAGVGEVVLANVLPAHAIHRIDLFRFLLGEPTDVYAETRSISGRHDDAFHATVLFPNAVAQLHYTMTSTRRHAVVRIVGSDLALVSDGEDAPYRIDPQPEATSALAAPGAARDGGYLEQDRHFLDCVRAALPVRRPAADLPDALATMRLLDAIRRGHKGALAPRQGRRGEVVGK
jgi:virulence factor